MSERHYDAFALMRRAQAISQFDSETAALKNSGVNLDAAVGPYWDRNIWEQYKSIHGQYPFNAANKPPDVLNAPTWVKQLCGVALTPAERMRAG